MSIHAISSTPSSSCDGKSPSSISCARVRVMRISEFVPPTKNSEAETGIATPVGQVPDVDTTTLLPITRRKSSKSAMAGVTVTRIRSSSSSSSTRDAASSGHASSSGSQIETSHR